MTGPILRVEDVSVAFGGVRALDGASLAVREGTITGLIGPNGAGKTTLFDVVTGFTRPDRGRVWLRKGRLDQLPPHVVARRGVARTFQIMRLFPSMSALQNLLVARPAQAGETLAGSLTGGWRRDDAANREDSARRLADVELTERADLAAGRLSYGQQKLLELQRALSLDAGLVLLDEPMAGVNPAMRQRLLAEIHRENRAGRTFLVIEHDLAVILEHCDEVVVMDRGRVIAQAPPERVVEDPAVVAAYLGSPRAPVPRPDAPTDEEPAPPGEGEPGTAAQPGGGPP